MVSREEPTKAGPVTKIPLAVGTDERCDVRRENARPTTHLARRSSGPEVRAPASRRCPCQTPACLVRQRARSLVKSAQAATSVHHTATLRLQRFGRVVWGKSSRYEGRLRRRLPKAELRFCPCTMHPPISLLPKSCDAPGHQR